MTLHELTQVLRDGCANLTFIKSSNNFIADNVQTFDISVEALSKGQVQCLRERFAAINVKLIEEGPVQVPWFPQSLKDLDKMFYNDMEKEPIAYHLVYDDLEYKKRRDHLSVLANNHKMGEQYEEVTYPEEEHALWRAVYSRLR